MRSYKKITFSWVLPTFYISSSIAVVCRVGENIIDTIQIQKYYLYKFFSISLTKSSLLISLLYFCLCFFLDCSHYIIRNYCFILLLKETAKSKVKLTAFENYRYSKRGENPKKIKEQKRPRSITIQGAIKKIILQFWHTNNIFADSACDGTER